MTKNKQKRGVAKRNGRGPARSTNPPTLTTSIRGRHIFRFICAAGSSTDVTLAGSDICTVLVSKLAGSTTSVSLIASARLRGARLWSQYTSQGTGGSAPSQIAGQPGLQIPATSNSVMDNPAETKSDVVLGVSEPGFASLRLPMNSAAGSWHRYDSTEPVIRICTGGTQYSCVLDLDVEYTLTDATHQNATFVGTSGSSTSIGSLSFTGFAPVGFQPQ